MTGCLSNQIDGHVVNGESVTWPGKVVDGPVIVERGGHVFIRELLQLRGPLIVRGEASFDGAFLRFVGDSSEAQILVDGGGLTVTNTSPEGLAALHVRHGSVNWSGSTIYLGVFEATDGSQVLISNGSITPSGVRDPVVLATDSQLSLVNLSATGFRFEANGKSRIRVINVGVSFDQFSGDASIERGWHTIVRPRGITVDPLPHIDVILSPTVGEPIEATTGSDGLAYVEVIELSVKGGAPTIHNPYSIRIRGNVSSTPFMATSENQEAIVFVAG